MFYDKLEYEYFCLLKCDAMQTCRMCRQQVLPKYWYLRTRSHGIICKKTVIFISTIMKLTGLILCVAVGTSNCFLHSVLQICGYCECSTRNEYSSAYWDNNSIWKHSWGCGNYRTCNQSSSQIPWDLALAHAWSRVGSPMGYYHNTIVLVISAVAISELSLKVAFINFISRKFSCTNLLRTFQEYKISLLHLVSFNIILWILGYKRSIVLNINYKFRIIWLPINCWSLLRSENSVT